MTGPDGARITNVVPMKMVKEDESGKSNGIPSDGGLCHYQDWMGCHIRSTEKEIRQER